MTDLSTDDDIRTVVNAFYADIKADPVLGSYFTGIELAEHLPRMVAFWSSIVFQTGQYRGQPFAPHARMPGLTREHFARWVDRFRRTVDSHYTGPHAEQMKTRAEQIAGVFQVKLGLWTVAAS